MTADLFDLSGRVAVVTGGAKGIGLGIARALALETESQARLTKMGVKFVTDVDKSGFIAAATPFQDKLAGGLGPHAVKILALIRAVP